MATFMERLIEAVQSCKLGTPVTKQDIIAISGILPTEAATEGLKSMVTQLHYGGMLKVTKPVSGKGADRSPILYEVVSHRYDAHKALTQNKANRGTRPRRKPELARLPMPAAPVPKAPGTVEVKPGLTPANGAKLVEAPEKKANGIGGTAHAPSIVSVAPDATTKLRIIEKGSLFDRMLELAQEVETLEARKELRDYSDDDIWNEFQKRFAPKR